MTVIASNLTRQRHVVRLMHAATGDVISSVKVAPVRWPLWWSHRVVDGAVIVTGPPTGEGAARIDVIVTDGAIAQLLTFPAPQPDQPADSVRVALTAEKISVSLPPKPLTLIVTIDGETAPSEGLDVTVTGASGSPTVTLTEDDPGVYSATQVWGEDLINADLIVGGNTVRKISLDYTRAKTRIHVVDPT